MDESSSSSSHNALSLSPVNSINRVILLGASPNRVGVAVAVAIKLHFRSNYTRSLNLEKNVVINHFHRLIIVGSCMLADGNLPRTIGLSH